jgi:energy-coupling factor transport system permease protein
MIANFKFIQGTSTIHRLDPRTKLVAFVLIMIGTIIIDDVRVLLVLLVTTLIYYAFARLPWSQTWKAWGVVLFFSIVIIGLFSTTIFGIAPAFIQTAHPIFSFPEIRLPLLGVIHRTVTWEIAFYGGTRMLRPIIIMSMILPFMYTTDPGQYGVAFRRLGLPDSVSFALDLSLRYVPTIARDFFLTVDAQRARGYELERKGVGLLNMIRRAAPLVVPVTINAIAGGEEIVDSMELRAFGMGPRTWPEKLALVRADYIVLAWAGLTLLVLLSLRLFTSFGPYWFPAAWFS